VRNKVPSRSRTNGGLELFIAARVCVCSTCIGFSHCGVGIVSLAL
jgi:hypothetical protein